MAEITIQPGSWKKEFEEKVTRHHVFAAWVAVILDPAWFLSDYVIIPSYWKIFLVLRIIISIITLAGIVFREKLKLNSAVIVLIPFLGISLQNAYMYSVMDVETLHSHTFAYIALFIGAGMFVIWKPLYSILVVIISLIGNIILFKIFSPLTLSEVLINGGMLTATVAIFSIVLTHSRYHSTKKEIISRLQLEEYNNRILLQKSIIEKNVSDLENINKRLNRFAYIISHDMKAPLRRVKDLVEWICDDKDQQLSTGSAQYVKMLEAQVSKMTRLIDGILEYSKAGHKNHLCEWVNVGELLNDVREMVLESDKVNMIVLPGMPLVYQNKASLMQVFVNLVGNAIKHNDKEKIEIKIYAIEGDHFFEFAVEDNGPGVAAVNHQRIFELFETIGSKPGSDYNGMGLPIVQKIIEECGGKVWIESSPGNGTTFKFTLPKQNARAVLSSEMKELKKQNLFS